MKMNSGFYKLKLKKHLFVFLISLVLGHLPISTFAQRNIVDSLEKVLRKTKDDTLIAILLEKQANALSKYAPDSAFTLARKAYQAAVNSNYNAGQSKSLGTLANISMSIGNYPKALDYNLQILQLEENSSSKEKLAGVLMNIGIVYVLQEQYNNALAYYYKADSVIVKYNIEVYKYNIAVNMGDVFDRLNKSDSAFKYFFKSLALAKGKDDHYRTGAALVGLGHSYVKMESYGLAFENYKEGIADLKQVDAHDLLCEAYLGMSNLHFKINKFAIAKQFADSAYSISKNDGFLPRQLEASQTLAKIYKEENNIDSSFFYLNNTIALNNEINSKARIRELQILSSSESQRQLEIAEKKERDAAERKQQLRLLFVGMLIPGFFVFVLLLSRVHIHLRILKFLGVLSLIFLFEYITLLFHPFVANLTHHNPFLEIIIFVAVAMIIIPLHHKTEKWLITWLLRNKPAKDQEKLKLEIKKIQINLRELD